MEIYRLYELIKMWEVALTLTRPEDIQSIKLRPVIDNHIEFYGEGKIRGSIEFTLEKEDAYTIDTIIDIYEVYRTVEESEEVQKKMVLCLVDYLEQYLRGDDIVLIWNQIDELALDWYEKT